MMHKYHPSLPDYSSEQVLVDGCEECEYRAGRGVSALDYFDTETAKRAYDRAHKWNSEGLSDISAAEGKVFDKMLSVERFLERAKRI